MASRAHAPAPREGEPDLASLKRRAEELLDELTVAIGARHPSDADGCEYLDGRRDIVVAMELRQAAGLLARAAAAEEVRAAAGRRQASRPERMLRALHVIAGGTTVTAAALVIGAVAGA